MPVTFVWSPAPQTPPEYTAEEPKVRLPFTFSVPIEVPGQAPPRIKLVGSRPVPQIFAAVSTVKPLDALIEPFTVSSPAFTVVAPV